MRVVRSLAAMGEVYRLSADGGPRSPRFHRYVELGRAGAPVSGYNPMTGKDALGTVEALASIDAEAVVGTAAEECLDELGLSGLDLELSVTVATPGMWTDRLATEVEHRLIGRTAGQVLFWTGEEITARVVRAEAAAQTVRSALTAVHGREETVAQTAGREGLACALAELLAPTTVTTGRDPAVAEALSVVGADTSLATKTALLYGDDAARAMGWTPLGLPSGAGYRHVTACAHAALAEGPAASPVT